MATHRRMTSSEIETNKPFPLPMAYSVISTRNTHHQCSCILEMHYNPTHSVPTTTQCDCTTLVDNHW